MSHGISDGVRAYFIIERLEKENATMLEALKEISLGRWHYKKIAKIAINKILRGGDNYSLHTSDS